METKAAVILSALSMGLGVGGCSLSSDIYADTPQVPRCSGPALPKHENPKSYPEAPPPPTNETYIDPQKWQDYQREQEAFYEAEDNYLFEGGYAPLDVTLNSAGFIDEDPDFDYGAGRLDDRISEGVVKISTDDYHGSGFITLDKKGNQVVVTAAHILKTTILSELDITTEEDQTTHPIDGCYILDNKGKHIRLAPPEEETDNLADYDLAVLHLEEKLDVRPLEISPTVPGRGDWVKFVNYQGSYPVMGFPSTFSGLVVAPNKSETGMVALTGLREIRPPITNGEFEDIHLIGGGSGGVVTDRKGKVIGISPAGTKDNIYDGPSELDFFYNVSFANADYGMDGGFVPTEAFITPANVIKRAIKSITNRTQGSTP